MKRIDKICGGIKMIKPLSEKQLRRIEKKRTRKNEKPNAQP